MDITQPVIGVIGICVLFVTLVILPLARAKFGNENVEEFLRWVKIGVQAAEQIYKNNILLFLFAVCDFINRRSGSGADL